MENDYWIADLTQITNDIRKYVEVNFVDHTIINEVDGGFEMLEGHQDTYFNCITPLGKVGSIHVTYNAKNNEIITNFESECHVSYF